MTDLVLLADVKKALGIEGDYQDDTIEKYVDEVTEFLIDAGVKAEKITVGVVARGVSDLWSYGTNDGRLSSYFLQRAAQLSYKS